MGHRHQAFADLYFDPRGATIDQQQATVTVMAAFGNVDIYVPEDINVNVRGLTVLGLMAGDPGPCCDAR